MSYCKEHEWFNGRCTNCGDICSEVLAARDARIAELEAELTAAHAALDAIGYDWLHAQNHNPDCNCAYCLVAKARELRARREGKQGV